MHPFDKTTIRIGLVLIAVLIIYLSLNQWLLNSLRITQIESDQKLNLALIDQKNKQNTQAAENAKQAIDAEKETRIHAMNAAQKTAEQPGKFLRVQFIGDGMEIGAYVKDKKPLLNRIV